jgi:hypothetical protein
LAKGKLGSKRSNFSGIGRHILGGPQLYPPHIDVTFSSLIYYIYPHFGRRPHAEKALMWLAASGAPGLFGIPLNSQSQNESPSPHRRVCFRSSRRGARSRTLTDPKPQPPRSLQERRIRPTQVQGGRTFNRRSQTNCGVMEGRNAPNLSGSNGAWIGIT